MHLPELQETRKNTLMTTVFLGLNRTQALQDGEMADMQNLSSRSYPMLDQRAKRSTLDPLTAWTPGWTKNGTAPTTPAAGSLWTDDSGTGRPVLKRAKYTDNVLSWETIANGLTGIHGRDKLVTVFGTSVYYNGTKITGLNVSAADDMQPKKIVSMGAYVCIWPDKVYFNAANTSDCGSMGRAFSISGANVALSMCRLDGTDYDAAEITTSATAPGSPTAGDYWMDTSGDKHVLKQYSSTGEWTEIATTYIKIAATGIGTGINIYDVVAISGMSKTENETPDAQVADLNVDSIVYGCGENYIIIAGILDESIAALDSATVHIDREIPDLDYVCESNNRIWGCRYGFEDGEVINEMRACRLGDFRNWNVYMGLSTDSYAVSVGTDGPFTGAMSQRGYPVFFKENCVHRISGNTPNSFTTSVIGCRGIQNGSWRSAATIDENIFYKATDGIYYFDGSMAYKISEALGQIQYSDARAGELNGKYYISMKDRNGEWSLFAYDTGLKLWHREDALKALGFATANGELYAIDEENGTLKLMTGKDPEGWGTTAEEDIAWSATFGLFGTDYTNRKYLSRFNLRMQMDEDAEAHLKIMYDQDGTWHEQGEIRGKSTRTFLLPVVPRRCDHLQIKISGKGRCRIYSMSRELEVGGDG